MFAHRRNSILLKVHLNYHTRRHQTPQKGDGVLKPHYHEIMLRIVASIMKNNPYSDFQNSPLKTVDKIQLNGLRADEGLSKHWKSAAESLLTDSRADADESGFICWC